MSTPRCPAKLNGNPPPTCRLERGHTGDHESFQPHGILSWAEGVAAPLEPTHRANDFFKANYAKFPLGFQQQPVVFEFAEAYAAAVSKNLQEEYDEQTEQVFKLICEKGSLSRRITELESEITALRETK
jgi:hypothetical protein